MTGCLCLGSPCISNPRYSQRCWLSWNAQRWQNFGQHLRLSTVEKDSQRVNLVLCSHELVGESGYTKLWSRKHWGVTLLVISAEPRPSRRGWSKCIGRVGQKNQRLPWSHPWKGMYAKSRLAQAWEAIRAHDRRNDGRNQHRVWSRHQIQRLGYKNSWKVYKLLLDTADCRIPVNVVITCAYAHDSQVAIPLALITEQMGTHCHDLMNEHTAAIIFKKIQRAWGI